MEENNFRLGKKEKERLYSILPKYKIKTEEIDKIVNGEISQEIVLMLADFIQTVLNPIIKFPADVPIMLLKDPRKAIDVIFAMDTAIDKAQNFGTMAGSLSVLKNFIHQEPEETTDLAPGILEDSAEAFKKYFKEDQDSDLMKKITELAEKEKEFIKQVDDSILNTALNKTDLK